MNKISTKLNHFEIGKLKLLSHYPMVMIYHDINHRKSRIFVNFRFSCSNFGGHFKGQISIHIFSSCVWLKRRALLKFSESLKPKHPENIKI